MNPQEAKEFVRRKVIECVPSILELKFGCRFLWKETPRDYEEDEQGAVFENWVSKKSGDRTIRCLLILGQQGIVSESHITKIIGRDIRLADVVFTLEQKKCKVCNGSGGFAREGYVECNDCGGVGYDFPESEWIFKPKDACDLWDLLDDSLDNQSPETWVALAEMMR